MRRLVNGALAAALFGAGPVAAQTAAAPRVPPPPPPLVIYDPNPGPYHVVIDDAGGIGEDQVGVIANAVANWQGDSLRAFLLCFRPKAQPIDWGVQMKAMRTVRQELKARGVTVVATLPDPICRDALPSSRLEGHALVSILGIVVAIDPAAKPAP